MGRPQKAVGAATAKLPGPWRELLIPIPWTGIGIARTRLGRARGISLVVDEAGPRARSRSITREPATIPLPVRLARVMVVVYISGKGASANLYSGKVVRNAKEQPANR